MMRMNSAIREMTFNREPTQAIRRQARLLGMRTLLEDGVGKALTGMTTLEEVLSICHHECAVTELPMADADRLDNGPASGVFSHSCPGRVPECRALDLVSARLRSAHRAVGPTDRVRVGGRSEHRDRLFVDDDAILTFFDWSIDRPDGVG